MSLFGSTSGFGTGGTSMFGSTTADNHNPMKVCALAPAVVLLWLDVSRLYLLTHTTAVVGSRCTVFKCG